MKSGFCTESLEHQWPRVKNSSSSVEAKCHILDCLKKKGLIQIHDTFVNETCLSHNCKGPCTFMLQIHFAWPRMPRYSFNGYYFRPCSHTPMHAYNYPCRSALWAWPRMPHSSLNDISFPSNPAVTPPCTLAIAPADQLCGPDPGCCRGAGQGEELQAGHK